MDSIRWPPGAPRMDGWAFSMIGPLGGFWFRYATVLEQAA
jgi:hypothetical protein